MVSFRMDSQLQLWGSQSLTRFLFDYLAAWFRICAHRLGWISSAIYAVFSALVALRFRRLRALTYDMSRCFRMVAFGFAFNISSCVHSLSMPSACCGSALFRIVYISTTCATVHTHRIPYRCCVPICLRHVHLHFAFDLFGCVHSPTISLVSLASPSSFRCAPLLFGPIDLLS
jgi:hypothetical protein